MCLCAKVDNELIPQYEPYLSPLVLKVWSENMYDPLLGPAAVAVIDALSSNSGCVASICRYCGRQVQTPLPSNAKKVQKHIFSDVLYSLWAVELIGVRTRNTIQWCD